jgi:hypothetical protein
MVKDRTVLGTLCVIDKKPRKLTSFQMETLKILTQAVITQLELRRAQEDLRDIEKILPMCSWCRRIKNDEGGWDSLQDFIQKSVKVTHGICPGCSENFISEAKGLK